MKITKTFVIALIALALLLMTTLVWRNRVNSVDYQVNRLKTGSVNQKIDAILYLEKNKVYTAIPDIVSYIDSEESVMRANAEWGAFMCSLSGFRGNYWF